MKKMLFLLGFFLVSGFSPRVEGGISEPCYKADIIFLIDYSGSMVNTIPYYEPWLRATAGELPLSHNLRAGLLLFSDGVCLIECPLTEDKLLLDERIMQSRKCSSVSTYIEPALARALELFEESERDRKEKVSRIIVVVTDSDVSDYVEACEFVYSEMSEVFFILIDLEALAQCNRIDDLKDCFLKNGIAFDGFVWIYEDLLKQFDPCM